MFRSSTKVITFLFLLVIFMSETCGYEQHNGFSDISNDLPQKSDLIVYLESLHRIIKFCSKNKYELDLNFEFGLFLTNVNLKSILAEKQDQLPKLLRMYFKLLLRENDDLIDYFNLMVKENHDTQDKGQKMIISLFSNEAQWMSKVPTFTPDLLINEDQIINPPSWIQYVKDADDLDGSVPNPQLSDMCMISLASNEVHRTEHSKCDIFPPCYDMLVNGSDYGYALSHRLLFLLNARYSRGCSVFSPHLDREMRKAICAISYAEAEYIAKHSYGIIDLFMEQITLCSLDGHVQFLQRHWLSNILRFQTSYGCFGQTPPKLGSSKKTNLLRSPKRWKMAKHRDHSIMGGLCNGHVTSVAAATLSAAIRYILQVYY